MMRLWKDERKTSPEIGHLLSFSPKTVRNRLSKLRKALGEELVPNRTRRRRARAL
jgi:DNA-directed RNA polymerase specialized sigma24 family protein